MRFVDPPFVSDGEDLLLGIHRADPGQLRRLVVDEQGKAAFSGVMRWSAIGSGLADWSWSGTFSVAEFGRARS
jgi:hypothetical protein